MNTSAFTQPGTDRPMSLMTDHKLVVNTSTVPEGTADKVKALNYSGRITVSAPRTWPVE